MEKRKISVGGKILITIGILFLAAAAGLVLYNMWDANRAAKASDAIVTQLATKIDENKTDDTPDGTGDDTDREMATVEIDGHRYIGILEVPVFNLRLPVMADWSYDSLKISPCRYCGSYYTSDLVICGHNYARHFSPLKKISVGSDVYFTAVDGTVYHYIVDNRETVRPTDISKMIENSANSSQSAEWDMTLFTCNTGGQTRCAVRCVLQKDEDQSGSQTDTAGTDTTDAEGTSGN